MIIGVYPGTFDPITLGHLEIIQRASRLVDKLYVCVALNKEKSPFFDIETRLDWIQKSIQDLNQSDRIHVIQFDGLFIETAQKLNAKIMIRGLRSGADFDLEAQLSFGNKKFNPAIETVFLISHDYPFISSSIVKSIIKNNGDVRSFVPKAVQIPV